jgi:hypothetical protein
MADSGYSRYIREARDEINPHELWRSGTHGYMPPEQFIPFSLNLLRFEWGRQTIGSYILPFRFDLTQVCDIGQSSLPVVLLSNHRTRLH